VERTVIDIVAVSVPQRVAITNTGVLATIDHIYDRDVNETIDPERAVVGVGKLPDGTWFVVNLTVFDTAVVH
jgi:hypothetical protein